MRRALVLTDEAARHPFLASLPPHVRAVVAEGRSRLGWWVSGKGWRDVVSTYCATFAAVIAFIA
jgi:hypothetical protein